MADEHDHPIRRGKSNGDKRTSTPRPAAESPARPEAMADDTADEDPYAHMTANQRFSQAIEKRDAMVREQQSTSQRQRRASEKSPTR